MKKARILFVICLLTFTFVLAACNKNGELDLKSIIDTGTPTPEATATPEPTATAEPTKEVTPTAEPTAEPTEEPTAEPTAEPHRENQTCSLTGAHGHSSGPPRFPHQEPPSDHTQAFLSTPGCA